MNKLSIYLIKQFIPIFFNIFSILFLITSIIIIISISNITSNFNITFQELLQMYLLSLPRVIFIALSISFLIATTSLFSQLSLSQEIIALFASGFKPLSLIKPFVFLAILFTIINLLILFISIPYAENAIKNLKIEKQQQAKFSFKTSEISQKFGDWSIFTSNKNKNIYKDIILYNYKTNRIILSKNASINNKKDYLSFNLNRGVIYLLDKNTTIKYNKLVINEKLPTSSYSIFVFDKYFNKFKKIFIFYLPFALMPIILIFFIPYISFFHPRINKKNSLIDIIFIIIIYTILTKITKSILIIILISIIFLIISMLIIKKIDL